MFHTSYDDIINNNGYISLFNYSHLYLHKNKEPDNSGNGAIKVSS